MEGSAYIMDNGLLCTGGAGAREFSRPVCDDFLIQYRGMVLPSAPRIFFLTLIELNLQKKKQKKRTWICSGASQGRPCTCAG
jgi:hypothetical protein